MKQMAIRTLLSLAAISAIAMAEEVQTVTAGDTNLGAMDVVDSKNMYRNRSETVTPNLVYDQEFFERFEPITAGDMLKRVPGVVFQGDVGEYDFIQFRGLATNYTQVLINGKRIPGAGPDREINLDRIPAEMIARIEIVRSPSAEIDSQGVAGTVNIILKDGASMDGGFYRIGVSRHGNGEDNPWTEEKYKPNAYLSYSNTLETFSYTMAAYYQERYNAKDKITNEFEDGKDDKSSWVYTEDEWDNRDSKDSSFYAKFDIDVTEADRLILSANYFHTEREEEQYEFKHERDAVSDPFELQKIEHQIMDIEQTNYTFDAEYMHEFGPDRLKLTATYDNFDGTLDAYEAKEKSDDRNDWVAIENIRSVDHEGEYTDTKDSEIKAGIGYELNRFDDHSIKVGFQTQSKHRDTAFDGYEVEDGLKASESISYGTHTIDENRYDTYIEDVWNVIQGLSIQIGGRLEYTTLEQEGTEATVDTDYLDFNPNLHIRYALSDTDQIRFSLAQTLRRPNFDEMTPFEADDEPADFDVLTGNPDLKPERSLGVDLGYEHAFTEQFGILGANLFHRTIQDKIEYKYTGKNLVDDDGDIVEGGSYTYENIGDGTVYGFELDSSFPLAFLGAPSVNFFANYSYLDSEIEDPFTNKKRRFNDQPDYVYNFGLNHTIRSIGVSYGFSYQQRGDSTYEDAVTTEVTSYDANLEAYIEYKLAESFVVRFTGDNLLDAEVTEHMTNYDSLDDKIAGKVDSYETQIERAGAVFMLTLSGRF